MATTAAPAELLGHPKGLNVAENISWSFGLALGGLMMSVVLVIFLVGQPHLLSQAKPAEPVGLLERTLGGLRREWLIYLGALAGVAAALAM